MKEKTVPLTKRVKDDLWNTGFWLQDFAGTYGLDLGRKGYDAFYFAGEEAADLSNLPIGTKVSLAAIVNFRKIEGIAESLQKYFACSSSV